MHPEVTISMKESIPYPDSHWIRSHDPAKALSVYLDQQQKVYSRIKNMYIKQLIGDPRGRRFLDFGCGAGMLTLWAAASGADTVIGVDAEESVLKTARYHAQIRGLDTRCNFMQSEKLQKKDFPSLFDVIVLKDVLEHIANDREVLADAARCLAPDGAMILSTQNAFSLNYLLEGGYHRMLRKNKGWFGWDETHLRFYTPFGLQKKLHAAGFCPMAWRSVYLIPYKIPTLPGSKKQFIRLDPISIVDRILGAIPPFNRLGWNIIVKVKKGKFRAQ